ncbi:phosphatidate cytidylyltransferase [Tahibacter soli]|uniref:Phosphatidate cytidylyltransferase n=1 Tax=Tahibacter soli TaxID=2983605 RepID=A0A9X3YHA8_9GAMM|nr:phosphatidate cytidylyltransferase [Tahibacter soli]MDC8011200.1 phosphatidate cytidylyltransferase [Tahibacter soli]
MTAQEKLIAVFGGVVGLLALATIVGRLLRRRGESAVVDNLVARVNAWWAMVAVLAVCFGLGPLANLVVFALISFFALREFITLTPTRPGDHLPLAVAFYVLVPLQYWLIWDQWYGLFAIFIPVYAFLALPALAVFAGDTTDFLERTTKIQWGVMITVYCISHAPALLMLKLRGYDGQGPLLLLYLLLVVQLSDVMQYVFGKLFGRHKLAPVVSPSKTVEGLVGGGLAAIAVGASLWWITPFSPLESAAMSALIVVCGALGGLALSAVKRSLGAKDWGRMIEGHGGMMDRMDSVCYAAPVFFHMTRWFYSG